MKRVLFVTLLLGGCATLPNTPVLTETLPGSYDRIGACVFERMGSEYGATGLTYSEMRGAQRALLRRMGGEVTVYEVVFLADGPSATRVEVKAHSMPGLSGWGDRAINAARACAAT